MEVRKAIKKMVALGTGLAMVGATVFGAAAADLSDYPSPMFITDGKFDGVIVVGDSAAASDVIGAVDIATSLQYSSTTVSEVSTSSAVEPTVSEGVRIAKSGDELNIDQDLADVEDKFDDVDLPDILPDGVYEDEDGGEEDYTQILELGSEAQVLKFYQDDDDAPNAGLYVHIVEDAETYNYTLEFDDEISGSNDTLEADVQDLLESSTLEIQGNTYTITAVEVIDAGIDKITLQAGEATVWLEEGVELTKPVAGVTHTISLQDVNEDEDKCGILVDDTLAWVDKGKTKTVNGVDIGVTDAIVVHSAGKDTDVCEVNLGASQVVLEDSKKVGVNGADIKGSNVDITIGTDGEWTGFIIEYQADDDVYLAAGDTWVDPVFGNFELKFAGVTELTEEMKMTVTGTKDAEFRFTSNDAKEVVIPFFYSTTNTAIYAGEDDDKLVWRQGEVFNWTTDVEDAEDYFIWAVSSNGEVHMVQIDDIDTDDNEIVIDDVTYDKTYTDDFDETLTSAQTISLGSFMDITLTLSGATADDTMTLGASEAADAESKYDATIEFNNTQVQVQEVESGVEAEVTLEYINVTLKYDSSNDMQISAIETVASFQEIEEDSDVEIARTAYGTLLEQDTEDDDYVKFMYPDEATYGNVFISPVGAEVVSGGSGGTITTTTVQKIQVGAAKLASEVADIKAVNAIVVGGPCANAAAATLMGNPEKCWESVPENKAIIKLYENGANVALLVAGRTALDTRRATRVLANAGDYAELTGMEVEVTGTSLTDIDVNAPTTG